VKDDDYIIQFYAVGKSVKAVALDPVTLKEVTVVAPRSTSKKQLAGLAVRKLEFVLNKDKDKP